MPSASPSTLRPSDLPTLKTPLSAGPTFPSQLPRSPLPRSPLPRSPYSAAGSMLPSELPRSPHPLWADLTKSEDDLKTPITPPTAYTDFLKALSPAVSSPSTGNSTTSSFSDKSGKLTPISQPSSAGSNCSCSCDKRKESAVSAPLVPPSPFIRPTLSRTPSGRTPTTLRKLRIPQSPAYSPISASPKSSLASTIRSPFSPADWILEGKTRYLQSPRSGAHRPVSVRQVVTRTVTYTRTPLDPAPKGKRRKIE